MPELARIPDPLKGATIHQLAPVGHNALLDRDEFLFLRGQLMAVDEEVVTIRKKRKALRNHLENNGVALEELDEANGFADMESETVLAKLQRTIQYANWMGLPIGSQVSFFDLPSSQSSQKPLADTAYDDGYKLGLLGRNADDQKWLPLTSEGMRHQEGWTDGQAVLQKKFIELNQSMAQAEVTAAEAKLAKEKAKTEKLAKKAGVRTDDEEATEH